MSTVTKRDLVSKVSADSDLSQQDVLKIVDLFLESMSESMEKGNNVVFRRFGSFNIIQSKPKIGRNPKRPEVDVEIPARQTVKFRPGKQLKERVAGLELEN